MSPERALGMPGTYSVAVLMAINIVNGLHRKSIAKYKGMNRERYSVYRNNPPHLFRPDAKYFITGAAYQKRHVLVDAAAKEKTIEYMFKSFEYYGWEIEDWVLLNNHYHIMANAPEDATTLSQVINNFHRFSANWVRKYLKSLAMDSDMEPGDCVAGPLTQSKDSKKDSKKNSKKRKTPIWYNYWDTCITYERSYFARLHYIWFNPVKHEYVDDPAGWQFGSFSGRVHESEPVEAIMTKYPCDRVNIDDDF